MNITLWVVQILLALAFIMAGFMKTTQPIEKLGERMNYVKHLPPTAVRLIGVLEILGGIGIVLPQAIKIVPVLTPFAATGLALTMIGAIITHIVLKEPSKMAAPAILLLLTLFVVYGRFVLIPAL